MPYGGTGPLNSTDPGQNLSLSTTNATQFAAASAVSGWVRISCPAENTAPVYIAYANTLTAGPTGTGVPMQPGDVLDFPAQNANALFARTATPTQNAHALAM